MSTISQVRAAWDSLIWDSTTVQGYTSKIYGYPIDIESEADAEKLYYNQRINFFTYVVTRESTPRLSATRELRFQVTLLYHLQQEDERDNTLSTLEDRLDAIDTMVYSTLGTSWNNTVDHYLESTSIPAEAVVIDGRRCWRGGFAYSAIKTV